MPNHASARRSNTLAHRVYDPVAVSCDVGFREEAPADEHVGAGGFVPEKVEVEFEEGGEFVVGDGVGDFVAVQLVDEGFDDGFYLGDVHVGPDEGFDVEITLEERVVYKHSIIHPAI